MTLIFLQISANMTETNGVVSLHSLNLCCELMAIWGLELAGELVA